MSSSIALLGPIVITLAAAGMPPEPQGDVPRDAPPLSVTFESLDTDSDGSIDRREFVRVFRPDDTGGDAFAVFDANGDARITRAEFSDVRIEPAD